MENMENMSETGLELRHGLSGNILFCREIKIYYLCSPYVV